VVLLSIKLFNIGINNNADIMLEKHDFRVFRAPLGTPLAAGASPRL